MLSQKLDPHEKLIPSMETSQNPTCPKTKEVYRVASKCSCPQCDSINCFKKRYENSNLLCSCPDCKETFGKNNSSKRSGDRNYQEITSKVKDDEQNHLIHANTISQLANKISDNECHHDVTKGAVKENEHKDWLDDEATNKKSNEKTYLELTRKDKIKPEMENVKSDDEIDRKILSTVKQYDQKKDLNTQGKKSDDQSNHEITEIVSEEGKQKDSTNTNHYFINKKFEDETHHETLRKLVKEDGKKSPLVVNIKCDHLNKNESIKERYEKKDTLSTQFKSKCDFGHKKSKDKVNHENDKMSVKNDEIIDTQNIESKSDYSNKKSDDKKCEKPQKYGYEYDQNKKIDDIKFSEITRKVFKEHEQKDTLNKHIKSENSDVDLCEHTEFSYKDAIYINDNIKKSERSYEESYTRDYSVAMTYTRKEEKTESENPTSTLSAQIMDLPYQDFKDSLSSHRPADSVYTSKISKQDFLAKLKEIYKACSCKVCECIPGFSVNNLAEHDSRCCEETKYKHTQSDCHNTNDYTESPHSGCACYRCDRKDCRGVWKNKTGTSNSCDCEPCDCVKYTRSFTKPCDCEPCQCAECASLNFHIPRSLIVAPVQGNFQQNLCQCEPCECVNCSHNYGAMASNLMREVSTGMGSHRNCDCETCANNSCQFDGAECRCDTQNRIVRKPIDRRIRDYDIHRALTGENSFSQKRSEKIKNRDTIAMFAFCNNNNSNTIFNKSGNSCNCMDCECIICKDKEFFFSKIKNSYEDIPDVFSNLSNKSFSVCKCQPCECQICCKHEEAESDIMQVTKDSNNCGCDICNCISCKGLPYCSQNKEINDDSESGFKNKSIDISIENNEDFSNKKSTAFVYPLKKGKLLTPSMFEAKILSQKQSRLQSSLPNLKKTLPSKSILKLNGKKSNKKLPCPQNITICHSKSVNKYCDNNINNSSINQNVIPTYLNNFDLENNPKHIVSTTKNNMTAYYDTIAEKCIDSIASLTNFIFPKQSPAIIVDKTKNEIINHSSFEEKNDEVKFLNSQVSNDHRTSKREKNGDVDLFCSRIMSFEKSIFQIQQDIAQYRTTLAEISLTNGYSHLKFSENNGNVNVDVDVVSKKSLLIMHKSKNTDSAKSTNFYKEPDKIKSSQNDKILCDIENKTILVDELTYDKNDSFSKGDNKMYVRLIKRSHINVNKLKKNVARSRIKKFTRNSENKVIDYISDQLKDNYRHHGSNRLVRKLITKSASTSNENFFITECQSLKLNDDDGHLQTGICQGDNNSWSVLCKNLNLNKTPVSHKEICTFPDLHLNDKRAVQSISLQTNETGGYAALTKLQAEVSKLLNSPLLQMDRYNDINVKDDNNNMNFKPKRKSESVLKSKCDASSQTRTPTLLVEKEINCNIGQSMEEMKIDMNKLLEFLLTRTVCKSELTKAFSTSPERPEVQKNYSVKSSCDSLKARFLTVRRVSDHSVLVRWRMPREVEDVQGYELHVDGRPVQKILSPTRCMAVLTCLPHCDKLLLTVRTLTHSVRPPALCPAATVVYCPREKRTRCPRQTYPVEFELHP